MGFAIFAGISDVSSVVARYSSQLPGLAGGLGRCFLRLFNGFGLGGLFGGRRRGRFYQEGGPHVLADCICKPLTLLHAGVTFSGLP